MACPINLSVLDLCYSYRKVSSETKTKALAFVKDLSYCWCCCLIEIFQLTQLGSYIWHNVLVFLKLVYWYTIFLKKFDPPNMLGFERGLKSALLNLVELGPGTRQIGPISGYTSTHQLHASHFELMVPTTKLIKKLWNLRIFLGGKGSLTPRKTE